MTRDPRAEWSIHNSPFGHDAGDSYAWRYGANDRLAALLPQLEAADALAFTGLTSADLAVRKAAQDFLAARDAHLTEGTPE